MGRSCFAPGCKSGYNWNDSSKTSTFSAPKDEHLFKLWEKAIPRSDLKLSHKSCLWVGLRQINRLRALGQKS